MNKTLQLPETLQEAVVFFSDPERTFQYAVRLRWPNGKVACPRCQSTEHSFISTRRLWFCKGCKKQFTVKVGTIFEDSALGMDKWMIAAWMLANCKNGISSYEMARALGVTQKSAWFMLHRIRLAMHKRETVQIGGSGSEVEVDETFIGGAARNMHAEKRRARVKRNRYGAQDRFRFNNRATKDNYVSDLARFYRVMSHIVNRRITHQELTGKGTDAVHQA